MSALEEVAREWQAEGHAAQVKTDRVVSQFEAATAPPDELPASDDEARTASGFLWNIIDVFAVKFIGPHAAQTPAEREQLIAATVPVAKKHLPGLRIGPEWTMLGVVGAVYAPKLLAAPGIEGAPHVGDASSQSDAPPPSPKVAA